MTVIHKKQQKPAIASSDRKKLLITGLKLIMQLFLKNCPPTNFVKLAMDRCKIRTFVVGWRIIS